MVRSYKAVKITIFSFILSDYNLCSQKCASKMNWFSKLTLAFVQYLSVDSHSVWYGCPLLSMVPFYDWFDWKISQLRIIKYTESGQILINFGGL